MWELEEKRAQRYRKLKHEEVSGAVMGGPARDEVMKEIPDRQGRLG